MTTNRVRISPASKPSCPPLLRLERDASAVRRSLRRCSDCDRVQLQQPPRSAFRCSVLLPSATSAARCEGALGQLSGRRCRRRRQVRSRANSCATAVLEQVRIRSPNPDSPIIVSGRAPMAARKAQQFGEAARGQGCCGAGAELLAGNDAGCNGAAHCFAARRRSRRRARQWSDKAEMLWRRVPAPAGVRAKLPRHARQASQRPGSPRPDIGAQNSVLKGWRWARPARTVFDNDIRHELA